MSAAFAGTDVATSVRGSGTGKRLTLRAKGVIAFVALVTYIGAAGYLLRQHQVELLRMATALEQLYAEEAALAKANYAIAHSLSNLQETLFARDLDPSFGEQVALDTELLLAVLKRLPADRPALAEAIRRLRGAASNLRPQLSYSALIELRAAEVGIDQLLREGSQQTRARRDALWRQYRRLDDRLSMYIAALGLLGAVFFGALLTLFLSRLVWDVVKLAARAIDVASGYRGPPLKITRHDELGDLMKAVNRMQSELRQRELQLELSREQHFHKEKMMAIGSLAAAVAHEVINPIAAIEGIAQSLEGVVRPGADRAASDPVRLILAQTQRIATITRQIGEITAQQAPEPQLLDLNALVRNTCRFVSYDKRFRKIDLLLELDGQIPAVTAVADHLIQVLMNLLINAADALESVAGRKPTIRVATRATGGEVVLTVADNGEGMDRDVLARTFEQSFTTKPPDKGRGLGLFLCKTLLESHGHRIELESTRGIGTTARIHLTLQRKIGD